MLSLREDTLEKLFLYLTNIVMCRNMAQIQKPTCYNLENLHQDLTI